jgi:predicted aspartyl protease
VAASPSRSFTYRYSRVSWGTVVDDAPMATAVLSGKHEKLRIKLLVDTGANRTFLPEWIARRLDLDLAPAPRDAQVAGGTLKVQASRVTISLADPDPDGRVGRTHVLDPVLIVDDTSLPFPVLGRQPFLHWYRLVVTESNQEFSLQETR